MRGLINPPVGAEDDLNLVLLRIAFPAFWFSQYVRGRRLRWVAVRKNGTDPGLHTMVTDDLAELCTALLRGASDTSNSWRTDYWRPRNKAGDRTWHDSSHIELSGERSNGTRSAPCRNHPEERAAAR